MKILIIGGTGLLGSQLSATLSKTGHEVEVWGRAEWNSRVLRIDGLGAIINLAGSSVGTRWTAKNRALIRSSRIEIAKKMNEAVLNCPQSARPKIIINASAIGFYGNRADEVLTEESNVGTGFLAQVVQDWESEFFSPEIPNVRKLACRLGLVVSNEAPAWHKLVFPYKLKIASNMGSGQQWFSWIHIEDAVNLFVHALNDETLEGPVNAVAPRPLRHADLSAQLKTKYGAIRFPAIPPLLLKAVLGEMSDLVLASQRVLPMKLMQTSFRFEYEKISQVLKHHPD